MKTDTIDLASLSTKDACEKGYELELKHPVTNDPLGVFISVVGSEADAFQGFIRRKGNERLRRDFENKRKGREEAPTIERAEKDAIALLAACTTGWRTGDKPTVTHGGKALEFSEANVKFLYAERWIRDQVDEAIGDLGNFMQA
jgi:hypothetical protein